MAIFSLALQITGVAANNPLIELQSTLSRRIVIYEMMVTLDSVPGAVSTIGFGIPAAKGIYPTRIAMLREDTGSVTNTYAELASAWTTPPTAPTGYTRRANMDNVVGQMIFWSFPRGIIIPFQGSMVLWSITQSGNMTITVVADV